MILRLSLWGLAFPSTIVETDKEGISTVRDSGGKLRLNGECISILSHEVTVHTILVSSQ